MRMIVHNSRRFFIEFFTETSVVICAMDKTNKNAIWQICFLILFREAAYV